MIRIGRIEDSTTPTARPLTRYRWMVLASPTWLATHDRSQSTNDLYQHWMVGHPNRRIG